MAATQALCGLRGDIEQALTDWLCHRATHIEVTIGVLESLIHLLMFAEVGIPLLAVLFLQVNAGILSLVILAFFIHGLTALWDVGATIRRIGVLCISALAGRDR